MSGITGTQAELLYSLAVPVTKNAYTTQAVMGPLAASAPVPKIPGGFFGENPNPLGRSLYLKALGSVANTGAATFAMELGVDPTPATLASGAVIFTASTPTASITTQWDLEVWITCQAFGETGGMTLQINGKYDESILATGGALSTAPFSSQFAENVTGLIPSTTYFLELWGTWSANSASNTTTIQQMFLWGLN